MPLSEEEKKRIQAMFVAGPAAITTADVVWFATRLRELDEECREWKKQVGEEVNIKEIYWKLDDEREHIKADNAKLRADVAKFQKQSNANFLDASRTAAELDTAEGKLEGQRAVARVYKQQAEATQTNNAELRKQLADFRVLPEHNPKFEDLRFHNVTVAKAKQILASERMIDA